MIYIILSFKCLRRKLVHATEVISLIDGRIVCLSEERKGVISLGDGFEF